VGEVCFGHQDSGNDGGVAQRTGEQRCVMRALDDVVDPRALQEAASAGQLDGVARFNEGDEALRVSGWDRFVWRVGWRHALRRMGQWSACDKPGGRHRLRYVVFVIRVRLPTGDVDWDDDRFKRAVLDKTLSPVTAVSTDGGATWSAALILFKLRYGSSDAGLGVLLPVKVEPTAMAVGYLALATLVMFGGPLTAGAAVLISEPKPTFFVKLGAALVSLVLGVLPPIGLGLLAVRRVNASPGSHGLARAYFSIGVGALLALVLAAGVVASLVR
jgi:hypothetical protein